MEIEKCLAKPDKTIEEHNLDLILCATKLFEFGYISEKEFQLLKDAIKYHDYGKCNILFQDRIRNGTRMDKDNEIYHNILSIFLLDKSLFDSDEDYYKVCYAILNHHHYTFNLREMEEIYSNKQDLIKKSLSGFEIHNIKRNLIEKLSKEFDNSESVKLAGLLMKCDYAGSANLPIEYINDFLNESMNNLLIKWMNNNPKAQWNEMQNFCIDNRGKNIVVQASTGMGKTEGALLWTGNNKSFYFLPIKSSIDAIFLRIVNNILNNSNIKERISLMHSDTLSIYDNLDIKNVSDYYKETRQFPHPLIISTLDQFFGFGYKYAGYELKVAALSYSNIIIDEIQALSSEELALLIYCLGFLHKNYGTNIAILTATLPSFIKDLLNKYVGDFNFGKFITGKNRHNVNTIDDNMTPQNVYEHYLHNKDNFKKILIGVSTVKKAQNIFAYFEKNGVKNVNMLHGRYIRKDRLKKEEKILIDGKTENEDAVVWIVTSIAEASLDIDFDFLITELKDLNSFFQIIGRLNRKGFKSALLTNCILFLKIDNYLKNKIIDKTLYDISYKSFLGFNGILSEEDKMNLVEDSFSTKNIKDSNYYKNLKDKLNELESINPYEVEKKDAKFRDIKSATVIPIDVYKEWEKEIDELIDSYRCAKSIDKELIKKNILEYTMNYPLYDYTNRKDFKNMVVSSKKLNDFESIYIVDCYYDFKYGFLKRIPEIFI